VGQTDTLRHRHTDTRRQIQTDKQKDTHTHRYIQCEECKTRSRHIIDDDDQLKRSYKNTYIIKPTKIKVK
jgi:hypothetical protein